MTRLLDLASEIEKMDIFNMNKIINDYKYIPFYDDLIKYSKDKNVATNCGITCFSWYGDISKQEAISFLKQKYPNYVRGE